MDHHTSTRRIRVAVLDAMRLDQDRPGTVHLELEAIFQHFEEGDIGSRSDPGECAGYLSGMWGEDEAD